MRKKKIIKIGLDFDGVVAYNPFRVIRAPVALFKKNVLGITKIKFFVPQNKWQRWWWILVHQSSFLPANGISLLRQLASFSQVELHLVTARFDFLQPSLFSWLDRHKLKSLFKTINVNKKSQQPHLYKEQIINKLKFDYYVEDNWDIVNHLQGKSGKTKVFWIYNIFDRGKNYQFKFPFLKGALLDIKDENTL